MTGAHRILQAGPLPPPLAQGLAAIAAVDVLDPKAPELLRTRAADYTLLVTTGTLGADAALLGALPRLLAICSLGVGYDTIDVAGAAARGIRVSNTPDVLNDCVADLALGLMIDVTRGISAGDRHVRRGDWQAKGPPVPATRISGKRLGLLGMGRIGQAIARRASGFDMDIRYHTRTAKSQLPWRHEPSLQALAQWCDLLVVACPGGPATRGLVSAEVLRALGPQGYLVNIARGSVVDERALVECLQAGGLAGAGLDVYENEPEVPAALVGMDNVVLLPHIGSSTRETRKAMVDLVLQNVRSFVERGELVTAVA